MGLPHAVHRHAVPAVGGVPRSSEREVGGGAAWGLPTTWCAEQTLRHTLSMGSGLAGEGGACGLTSVDFTCTSSDHAQS